MVEWGKGHRFLLCFKQFPILYVVDGIAMPSGNDIWYNISTLYVIYYILPLHERVIYQMFGIYNLQVHFTLLSGATVLITE